MFVKRVKGGSGVLQMREYAAWMSERTHFDLLWDEK